MARFAALTRHSLKTSLSGRRAAGLLLAALVPLALAAAAARWGQDPAIYEEVTVSVGVALVVPLIALVASVGALRDDVHSGAIVHLVTRPVRREAVLAARVLAAWVITLGASLVALSLPLVLFGSQGVDAWWVGVQATVPASAAYASLFTLLGVIVDRAALVGLVYLVAWEVVVATSAFFFRYATVAYWVRSLVAQRGTLDAAFEAGLVSGDPASLTNSLIVLAGIVLVAVAAGAAWFARLEFRGPEPEA